MRRRLVAALVGVAVATLLLYAVPRSVMLSNMVREREELGLERAADLMAETLDLRAAAGRRVGQGDVERLRQERQDLRIDVDLADGRSLVAGTVDDEDAAVTRRPLADGGRLTVALSADAVDERVADALVPVAVFGAISVLFASAVAVVLARRLATPFARLAEHAERIDPDAEPGAPRAGVPEADQIADALDRSQLRINELVRREREFSSNASHQLRTPLAALRLRIEDLSTWPDATDEVRAELAAALAEVDRLADTVTDLLELARSGGLGGWRDIDLDEAAETAAARWQERFTARGRRIAVTPSPAGVVATGSERAVQHVLDVLFENAVNHGAGVVDVTVQEVDGHGIVRVADEGAFDRAMTATAFTRRGRSKSSAGSGIGLDLARTIAESGGARLRLVSHTPTVFELVLPIHRGNSETAGALSPDR